MGMGCFRMLPHARRAALPLPHCFHAQPRAPSLTGCTHVPRIARTSPALHARPPHRCSRVPLL